MYIYIYIYIYIHIQSVAVPVLSFDRCLDARSLRGSHVPDLRARISVEEVYESGFKKGI